MQVMDSLRLLTWMVCRPLHSFIEFLHEQPSQFRYLQQYQVASLALKSRMSPKLVDLPKKRGIWLHGQEGIGKTTMAIKQIFNGQRFYTKDTSTITWDGYEQQQFCLIDDLNPGNRNIPMLKNLINILPARMNVKYGKIVVVFQRIVVTTQYDFEEMCDHDEDLMASLRERFIFATIMRSPTRQQPQKRVIVYL